MENKNPMTENKNEKVEAKVETKTVASNTTIGDEIYTLAEDADFLTTDLKITFRGWNYGSKWDEAEETYVEDNTNFQVQASIFTEEKGYEKRTLRVNKRMTESEVDAMVEKTYEIKNVDVYHIKDDMGRSKTAYGTNFENAKEIKSETEIFEANTYTKVKIDIVLEEKTKKQIRKKNAPTKTKEVPTGNQKLQALVKIGKRFDVKNFIITGRKKEELEKYVGKTVLLSGLEYKKKGGISVYETDIMPVEK